MHGWLLRFDPASNAVEIEVGSGGAVAARGDGSGLTAVVAGRADAEALLADFERSGTVRSLPGPTATAVYDARLGTLSVARDRTGLHPLFFAQIDKRTIVSTDARALLSEPGFVRRHSRIAVAAWLARAPLAPEETLFEGLLRIPAGTVMVISAGGIVSRRDWEPPPPRTYAVSAAMQFGERLEAAVDRLTRGSKAGVFLSGGIDSSSVAVAAATAARRSGGVLPLALSLDFEGASELVTQQQTVRSLALEHVVLPAMGEPGLLARALRAVEQSLWPTQAPWAPFYDDLVQRGLEEGVAVLLDGDGGDDLLDVSRRAGREFLTAPRAFADWLRAESLYVGSVRLGLRTLAGSFRPRRPPPLPGWIAEEIGLREELTDRLATAPRSYSDVRAADLIDAGLAAQRERSFDHATRHGLMHAHPFWDDGVVELLDGLPPEALVANGDPKSPALHYLRANLDVPASGWPRPGLADILMGRALEETSAAWIRFGGKAEFLTRLGVVEPGVRPDAFPFAVRWSMLSLETWLRVTGSKPYGSTEEIRA